MNESAGNKLPPMAILAGGLATRLRPLTETIPKSMIEVAGQPFIAHQLRLLVDQGFDNVVLLCGFLGEQIESFVGNGADFGCRVEYVFDGDVLRGTGGALRNALAFLGDEFMVIYGDSYCPTDYRRVFASFAASGRMGAMTVFHNRNRWDPSNVEFRDGKILCYDKKNKTPAMEHIDYGVGAFKADVFSNWPEQAAFDLSAVQAQLLAEDQLVGIEVGERFYEIGSHAGIQETSALLSQTRQGAAGAFEPAKE